MYRRPFVLAASIAALVSHSATAQTTTGWTGTGPGNLWSTATNWIAGTPGGGDILLFGNAFVGAGSLISNNDLTGYNGYRITFEDTAAAADPAFTINGNALTLLNSGANAPRIENQSSSLQTIALSGTLTLNGGTTNSADINPVNGDLLISNTVALAGNTQLQIAANNGHAVTFGGVISGTGNSVTINGNTSVFYGAANTYTGDTIINAGSLSFAQGGSITSGTLQFGDTSGVASANLQISDLDGGTTIARPIVVRAGSTGTKTISASNTSGVNTFSGAVTLNDNLTIETAVAGTGNLTMSGVISGNQSVTKAGAGLLVLSGANSFSGGLVLNDGFTRLTAGNTMSGGITLNSGATLEAITPGGDSTAFNNFLGSAGNSLTFNGGTFLMNAPTTGGNVDRTLTGRSVTVNASGATFDTQGVYTNFVEGAFNQLRLSGTYVLSGNGTITKNGGGRVQFQANTSSGFTGAIVINNGTLWDPLESTCRHASLSIL